MARLLLNLRNFSSVPKKEALLPTSEDDSTAKILSHHDYFKVRELFTVRDLFDARIHLAHKETILNPFMRPYMFGSRLGYLIFDLDQTAELLGDALNIAAHMAYRDAIMLFVSRHRQTSLLVEQTAKDCGEYAHTRSWNSQTLTRVDNLHPRAQIPDLVIIMNTLDMAFAQHKAVRDAAKMLVPTIGIVDSNCDPRLLTYPVPGNDDSPSAVSLYCRLFKEAILIGKSKQKEQVTT